MAVRIGSQDATIRVGSEAGPSFEAKVTDINVYCAVLDDDSIDPRLSPVMPVEQNCSPFLACSDELRSAIHFLSALSKANAHIVAANGAAAGAASPTVKLTVALPKGKVAVTAEGFTLNEEHFKNDAKFSNLQGDVLVFHGVTIDEQVTETISSAYETCFRYSMTRCWSASKSRHIQCIASYASRPQRVRRRSLSIVYWMASTVGGGSDVCASID